MRWPLIGVTVALGVWIVMQACARKKTDCGSGLSDKQPRHTAATLASGGSHSERGELPLYVIKSLEPGETISIDGRLDEPVWLATATTRAFVHPGTGDALSPEAALGGRARLRYDDHALYFAIEARDRDVRGGFDAGSIDPHLWTRDTVEIMLDPDGDGDNRDYYELQINPQGLVFDSQFDAYNQPRVLPDGPFGHQDFDSKVQRAVTIQGTLDQASDADQGYIVEGALPWKSLTKAKQVPPHAGDEWRANIYVMQDNGGVSWSPILGQGNFHKASRFGRLRFEGR